MNLNEATQLLRKNGYIVESVFDNPEYKEWYGIFHDKLLDAFVSLEICDCPEISDEEGQTEEDVLNDPEIQAKLKAAFTDDMNCI